MPMKPTSVKKAGRTLPFSQPDTPGWLLALAGILRGFLAGLGAARLVQLRCRLVDRGGRRMRLFLVLERLGLVCTLRLLFRLFVCLGGVGLGLRFVFLRLLLL